MASQKTKGKIKVTRKRVWICIFLFVICAMIFRGLMQIPRINERKSDIEKLTQEKIYEEARAEEVEELKEIVDTDEYIEKVAREKLGLVHQDEKIFIDVSKKDN